MSDSTKSKMNEDTFKQKASKMTDKDARKVVENAENIISKVLNSEVLKQFSHDVQTLIELLKDFIAKKYTDVPWMTVAAIIFALLYILSPIDIIPDVIPVIGLSDDLFVLSICLGLIKADLAAYRVWRSASDQQSA